MIQSQRGFPVRVRDKCVGCKPPEQGAFAHAIVAAQDHLLLGYAHRGHGFD